MEHVRVLIVGAGEVGSYVAERLSQQDHDVVVIDRDYTILEPLRTSLDVLTVTGSGTNPKKLAEAGIDRADLLVAVTDSDEVNLLACLHAKQVERDRPIRTIARIEDPDLRGPKGKSIREAVGVSLVLDPDEQTASSLLELLDYRGASYVHQMFDGELLIVEARLGDDAELVGMSMSEVGATYEPDWAFIFGVLQRAGETTVMRADTVIEPDDHLRAVCLRKGRSELLRIMGLHKSKLRRVMLLGGGRTAELLAKQLADRGVEVVVVERDRDRCVYLGGLEFRVLAIEGDIQDVDLLEREGVGDFDAVVATTGEDDANVLACLYAKNAGASEALAVVHRLSLLQLLEQAGIDAALSPRTATANSVLGMVRGGVSSVATFLEGDVEALELEVMGGSKADGSDVRALHLPGQMLLAAIVRDGKARIARGHSTLRARDHVLTFVTPEVVDEVKQIFG